MAYRARGAGHRNVDGCNSFSDFNFDISTIIETTAEIKQICLFRSIAKL